MYFLDFAKNLFRKTNVGLIVYLILNLGLLFVMFGSEDPRGIPMVIVIYMISLIVALSPAGEALLRWQTKSKKISDDSISSRIDPLFREVYKKAITVDQRLSKNIEIFINSDPSPNAFAVGRNTICINEGLLQLPDREILAILAHEFGHLSNKDTDALLVVSVGNMLVTGLLLFFKALFRFAELFLGKDGIAAGLGYVFISLFMYMWTKLGIILINFSGRQCEYEADKFASKLGYGAALAESLNRISSTKPKDGFLKAIMSSHPDSGLRVAALLG